MLPCVTLKSNQGSESLTIEFEVRNDCGPDPGSDAKISLHYLGERSHPNVLDLGRIQLSLVEVEGLVSNIERWIALPLDRLAVTPLSLTHDLAFMPPTQFEIEFGTREDIASEGKPVLTSRFAVGSVSGESHFITDQSCIRQFDIDLRAALNSLGKF